jgi:hypothetical protein
MVERLDLEAARRPPVGPMRWRMPTDRRECRSRRTATLDSGDGGVPAHQAPTIVTAVAAAPGSVRGP